MEQASNTPRIKRKRVARVKWTPSTDNPDGSHKVAKTTYNNDKDQATNNNKDKSTTKNKDKSTGKDKDKSTGKDKDTSTNKDKDKTTSKDKETNKDQDKPSTKDKNKLTTKDKQTNNKSTNKDKLTGNNKSKTKDKQSTNNNPEQMLDKWDDDEDDMSMRTKKFQNLVVDVLKDICSRLKEVEGSTKGCVDGVTKLHADVKELEVDHIQEKAADSELSTYWQAATHQIVTSWFPQRKFPHEIANLLELAEEVQVRCNLVTSAELLSKLQAFRVYAQGCLRQERYNFSSKIHGYLQNTYPQLLELGIGDSLGKGRRMKDTEVKNVSKAERHALRKQIWKKLSLQSSATVHEHTAIVMGNIMAKHEQECANWTPSDKIFARVIIEFFLRVKKTSSAERRYMAIKEVDDTNETDHDQICFEYSSDEAPEDDTRDNSNDECSESEHSGDESGQSSC